MAKIGKTLKWNGRRVSEAYKQQMFVGIKGAAKYLTEYIKRSFATSKSGKLYTKSVSGTQPKMGSGKSARRRYRASAKDETPAVVSGKLRAAVTYQLDVPGKLAVSAKVGVIGAKAAEKHDDKKGATTTGNVALILELGLGNLSGPHPFIRPAFDANRAVIKKIIVGSMSGLAIAKKGGGKLGFTTD